MAAQNVSSLVALAHFNNSTICLSHSIGDHGFFIRVLATDHVVGNPSLIYNLLPPKILHSITLANGSKAQLTGIGQASPLSSLSLDYVLFVPDCPFNLISINKFTRSLNCYITFTSGSLFIKDQRTGNKLEQALNNNVSITLNYLHQLYAMFLHLQISFTIFWVI
jgi:hypothetical protein